MSYRNPQFKVFSNTAIYQNFFDGASKNMENLAEIAKENQKENEKIDEDVEEYDSKVRAGVIQADTSDQIDLVESYQPVLDRLSENKKRLLKGGLTKEQKAEYRTYEQKAFESINIAKRGIGAMAEKGLALFDAKKNRTFDNTLNDFRDVAAFESINKGGKNKIRVNLDDPTDVSWVVSTPTNKDNPQIKSTEIASFNFNNLLKVKNDDTAGYWTEIPKLTYPGAKGAILDKNGNFLEDAQTIETKTLKKETKKKKVYQVNRVLDLEASRQPGSALDTTLRASARAMLDYPQEAASLWNNKLRPLDKSKPLWLGTLNGTPITKEQENDFINLYAKSFYEGEGKSYAVKGRTIEESIPQEEEDTPPPKPGKEAAALLAKIKSLKNGQTGSFITHKNKTIKQTGDNEWTLTEEVVDKDGNTSTKVISKVDDPQKLKGKFGISDETLVSETAEVDIDTAVNSAFGPETPNEEQ